AALAWSVIVTVALGTAAPFESTTRPLILPRDSWELAEIGSSNAANTKTIATEICANGRNLDVISNLLFSNKLRRLTGDMVKISNQPVLSLNGETRTLINLAAGKNRIHRKRLECSFGLTNFRSGQVKPFRNRLRRSVNRLSIKMILKR